MYMGSHKDEPVAKHCVEDFVIEDFVVEDFVVEGFAVFGCQNN